MGSYRCGLQQKLKPKYHDEFHSDWHSYVCPILRDELLKAVERENYVRLQKLVRMGIEVGQIESHPKAQGEK